MKKTVLSGIALLLALTMIFVMGGCGNKKTKTDTASTAGDDDFFTDQEVEMKNDSKTEDTSSSKKGSNQSIKSSATKENRIAGKTWKDVLKSMPSNLKGTTVTVYNWNPRDEYTGAPTAIKNFEKETGITVKWITENYDTYLTKLAAMVASNNAPDIVRTLRPDPIALKSLQPITATKYDYSDSAWDKSLMKDYTYNGRCYATSLKNTHIAGVSFLLYNKSLINKYDLSDPYKLWKSNKWTMNAFLKLCKEYKKESKADFACGGQDWSKWSQIYGIAGPVGFSNGKFSNKSTDAKLISVTQKIADLYNTDHLLSYWKADEFNSGDCLFWAGGAVFARRQNAYFASLKSTGSLNVVPMPAVDGQGTYYQDMSEYEAYGIAKGAKNAVAAPYFLRYFLDPANYNLSSFFCSKQALEVYNWCMEQKNKVWTTNYSGNSQFYGTTDDGYWDGIKDKTGAQIISFLKSNSSVIQQRVDRYNKAIGQLQK